MRDNKSKIIALVALMVAVVGLGIGFAAFSSTLTIESGATVTPNASDWNVAFDKTFNTVGYECDTNGATIVSYPTVEGTTISGLKVALTEPGQYVSCDFEVVNTGKYRAYLTKLEFAEETLSCTALEENDVNFPEGYTRADDALVADACAGIHASVLFGSDVYVAGNLEFSGLEPGSNSWTTNEDDIYLDPSIGVVEGDEVEPFRGSLAIEYLANSERADGPFIVEIPTATLTFSTVDRAS